MPRRRPPRIGSASAHRGRWVALSENGAIGTGITAADAARSAKLSRSKEMTEIVFYPSHESPAVPLPPLVGEVRRLVSQPSALWLVGGAVRDLLMRRTVHDLDFATQGDGVQLARLVADKLGGMFYPLDETRGVGRVIAESDGKRLTLDFTRLRGDSLTADLAHRDFTVNAMAISLAPAQSGTVFDPMGGQEDLRQKLLRMCKPSAFIDDPVRVLRAVRLAAQLGFRIERETRAAARAAAHLLPAASPERWRDEFMRAMENPKPAATIRAFDLLGVLQQLLPEALDLKGVKQSHPHLYNVWEHSLAVLDKLEGLLGVLGRRHDIDAASEYALGYASARVGRYRHEISDHLERPLVIGRSIRGSLFLSALLHDIGKPQTKTVDDDTGRIRFLRHEVVGAQIAREVAERFRLSNEETDRLVKVVANHMRLVTLGQLASVTPRAIYRFFKDTGDAGVDICLLALADLLGTRGTELGREEWATRVDMVVALLDAYFLQPQKLIRPPSLITGHDVMSELGMVPGRRVGELLEAVREAQVDGRVTSREQAIEYLKQISSDSNA